MSKENVKRLIALAIGVGTLVAGLFTWRAGQIGSAASFDDRTAVGQQVDVENSRIDVAVEAARQARQYDVYLGDFAVAAELDARAAELRGAGQTAPAALAEAQADQRREVAALRARDAGVFGADTLAPEGGDISARPRSFDLATRIDSLTADEATGLDSDGDLNPQQWADDADDIRERIRNLTYWVGLMLVAVVLLTAAEVTVSRAIRRWGLTVGVAMIVLSTFGGLTTGYLV